MTDVIGNNKRIAKNTLLLYFRMLLMMLISLYTSRIVLATLGEIDYGIYNVVGGFVAMFSVISGAMTTAAQRFISFEIGKGEQGNVKAVFSTAILIHIALAIIILIAAETVGLWFLNTQMNFPPERYVAANWVFQFSVVTFLISVVNVPYMAALIAYERMKAFAYVSIIEAILKLLIVYLLVISSFDRLVLYALLLAVISIVIRIIYGIYCGRNFSECKCNWRIEKNKCKEMFSFAGWNMIGSVAGVAKEQGINVVLNLFFGAAVNAARGIAYQVLNALSGFVGNFQLAMNPQIIKSYAADERNDMFLLVIRGSKFSFLLLLILSLPVIIEAPFILDLWLKEVPQYTVIFLRLVLITALIDSISGPLITSMHASGKVRDYQLVVGGISLLTLPVAYLFLKLGYPPCSAMIVGIFFSILCLMARVIMLRLTIKFPVAYFFRYAVGRIVATSLCAVPIPLFVYWKLPINWISFFLVCFACLLVTGLSCYYIGLQKDERGYINNKVKSILSRITE